MSENQESSLDKFIPCTPSELVSALKIYLRAGTVPLVTSSPGIGKSSIANQLAEEFNLKLIDERLAQSDPVDLKGFPTKTPYYDESGNIVGEKASYIPFDTYPLENEALPKRAVPTKDGKTHYNGWLLFFDEIVSAPPSVQAAAYKIILDRQVGQYKLHPNVVMMAAGNRITDGAVVNKLSTALQSRLVHLNLVSNLDDSVRYFLDKNFDMRIIAYLNFAPQNLNNFERNNPDMTFACGRTWEYLNNTLQKNKNELSQLNFKDHFRIIAGIVGQKAAQDFIAFCDIWQKTMTFQEVMSDPLAAAKKCTESETSVTYAMTAMVAGHLNETNAGTLMPFIDGIPAEFKILLLRMAVARPGNGDLLDVPAIDRWVTENSKHLL